MMGLFDFLRRPATEEKASAVGGMSMIGGLPPARWSGRNYQSYAKEAYQKNVVAFQAIDRVARAASEVRFTFWNGETEITDGELPELIARPNPVMTTEQYIQTLIGYWLLSGNRYQERVMIGAKPRELYPLRPDRMSVIPAGNGLPAAYEYKIAGRAHRWDMDPTTFVCDVLHERTFHPLDEHYGMSPIEAGAYAVDQHNETMRYAQSVMQNSARPSGALVSDRDLSDDEFNRLKQQLEGNYQGSGNAGRPMLLEGGMKWQAMGLSPKDVDMLDSRYAAARDVCLALGVPPLLLNIPGDSTYSNYKEARQAFWEDTVCPLVNQIVQGWNGWLSPYFGDVQIKADYDHIPAMVEKRAQIWEMAEKSTILTVNERREMIGYEPTPGGDVLLVSANQISMEDAAAPMTAPSLTPDEAKALAYGDLDHG